MRRFLSILIFLALGIPTRSPQARSFDDPLEKWLTAMTLDQKVGQVFMATVYGPTVNDTDRAFLAVMEPGAIALSGDNGTTPDAVTMTTDALQEAALKDGAHVPLILAIDHEGGTVNRLTDGFTALPWGGALGAMPLSDVQTVGQMAGEELSAVGINMNLAPVSDVRTRPDSFFMAPRVFGVDPAEVGAAVSAYAAGLRDRGVIPVFKHFPGHGDASDSHVALPTVNDDRDRVWNVDLLPFRTAIEQGAEAVMVGHLLYPALDPDLPASLSPAIIGGVLRQQIGFTGVVMTDAMDMGAIVNTYTRPTASVMALQAGADMIIAGPHTPLSEQEAMKDAVVKAVQSGTLPADRLDEAVRRILMLKLKYGRLDWTPLDPATAADRVDSTTHQAKVASIYLDTVAIAKDRSGRVPIEPGTLKVGIVYPGVYPGAERACEAIDKPFRQFAYSLSPDVMQRAAVHGIARDSDVVVAFTYNIHDYPAQADLVNMIPPEKAIVVALQSPFDIERGINPGAYITIFNPYPPALKAACAVLYGQHPPVGQWAYK